MSTLRALVYGSLTRNLGGYRQSAQRYPGEQMISSSSSLWTTEERYCLPQSCGITTFQSPPQDIIIETTGKDIKDAKDGLPPLRNPPLLETADDLATLSHLNEPSGL